MITKAYIQEVLTPYAVRVRIPLYHKLEKVNGSTATNLLPVAYISTPPNVSIEPKVGDIVIVSFEEDDYARPLVIGYLYSAKPISSELNILCDRLEASGEIKLSDDIVIGEITYDNIECLKNQKDSIPDTFKSLASDITNLSKELGTTRSNVSANAKDIESNASDIAKIKTDNASAISELSSRVSTLETKVNNIVNDYLKRAKPILTTDAYGKTLPTKDKEEGQVYFALYEES